MGNWLNAAIVAAAAALSGPIMTPVSIAVMLLGVLAFFFLAFGGDLRKPAVIGAWAAFALALSVSGIRLGAAVATSSVPALPRGIPDWLPWLLLGLLSALLFALTPARGRTGKPR
jgi:hypothetical protein